MSDYQRKILSINGITTDTNINSIIETIEKRVNPLTNKRTAKRILTCIIELVQNNQIHNKSESSEITISETNSAILLKISQNLYFDDAQKILKSIKNINQHNIEELKIIYRQNLDNNNKTTGNGLLSCRIKSENTIDFNSSNSDLYEIILKFNKQ